MPAELILEEMIHVIVIDACTMETEARAKIDFSWQLFHVIVIGTWQET